MRSASEFTAPELYPPSALERTRPLVRILFVVVAVLALLAPGSASLAQTTSVSPTDSVLLTKVRADVIAALAISGPTLRLGPERVAELKPVLTKEAAARSAAASTRTRRTGWSPRSPAPRTSPTSPTATG